MRPQCINGIVVLVALTVSPVRSQDVQGESFAIKERGLNHRVIQRVVREKSAEGQVVERYRLPEFLVLRFCDPPRL